MTGCERRRQTEAADRYEAGYQKGLLGRAGVMDKAGHTAPFLRGLHAGDLEYRRKKRDAARKAAKEGREDKIPKRRMPQKVQKLVPSKERYLQILDAAIARASQ